MKIRSPIFFSILAVLFFLSGACGLVYEMIWVRKLGLIFGNTTLAISTVLAVFMGGLGLGSLYFGRRIDRSGNPLLWYGILELGVGAFCFCTPWLWGILEKIYVGIYQSFHLNFWSFSLLRFCLCFVFLFTPTFLMGGTLPLLVKFFLRDRRETTRDVGFLYGINTCGAVFGVLGTSFFAIYVFGLTGTVLIAACVNLLIGVGIIFLLRLKALEAFQEDQGGDGRALADEGPTDRVMGEETGRLDFTALRSIIIWVFALSGFTSMAYELCWTKVLALCLGSSVYSFAVMLAAFLTGLALGSLLVSVLARKIRIDLYIFGLSQVLIALFVLWGMNAFDQMPIYFLQLFAFCGENSVRFHVAKFFLAGIVILPPTIVIGGTLAIVTQILNRSFARTGQSVGHAYFVNTLGCVAGSICSGFILVPWLGIYKTLILMVLANAFMGALILYVSKRKFSRLQAGMAVLPLVLVAVLLIQARPWSKSLLTSNIAIDSAAYLGHSKFEIVNSAQQCEVLYYKEGLSSTVAVKRYPDNVSLSINANVDASNGADMYTQLMLGHLPTFFVNDPKRVLVIGMGSGVTLGALAAHDYQEIHCVEIEGAVLEAATYFSKENRQVLSDPRLTNFVNDARNHLLTEKQLYDVIISEPSSPWMAGVANLFSREQFALMEKRLSARGVVCQWLNTYSMSPLSLKMIIGTFRTVFPFSTLWQTTSADLLLLGSRAPIVYDLTNINEKIRKNPVLRQDLKEFKIFDATGLLSCFLLSDDELGAMSKDAPFHSDNMPLLEYASPLNLYGFKKVMSENLNMLMAYRRERYPLMVHAPQSPAEKITFHNTLARAFMPLKPNDAVMEIGLSNREEAFNPGAVLNYGILQTFLGNPDEAIANLENYRRKDPDNPEANFYLGRAYEFKQDFDQAAKYYQLAASLEPDNKEYLFDCGRVLAATGKRAEAVGFLRRAIGLRSMDFQIGLMLAQSFFLDRQPDPAFQAIDALLKDHPYIYKLYEAKAGFYEALGQDLQALSVYQEALRHLPFDARICYAISLLYEKTGQLKRSRMMAQRYLFYQNAPKIGQITGRE